MSNNTRKKSLLIIACLSAAVIASILWLWQGFGKKTEYTDNAYVQGDITAVSAKVAGYVVEVLIDDNTPVKSGDVLFRIDNRDYMSKVLQAEANVKAMQASITNVEASIAQQYPTIEQAEAKYLSALAVQVRADQENARQIKLRKTNSNAVQHFEDAVSTKAQADAAVTAANASREIERKKLDVLAAQLENAKAGLAQAAANLDLARLDLEHTVVRAPVDGVVGNRKIRTGRYASPGATMMDIVPVNTVWIVANFKETQLEHMRIGQAVNISVDGYPDAAVKGVVDSLAPGSGSAFSLLPPDNATGNFIRVVQRVPVKIRLTDNPLNGRLVPGLSTRVTVNLDQTNS